jgi:hypothetical protein
MSEVNGRNSKSLAKLPACSVLEEYLDDEENRRNTNQGNKGNRYVIAVRKYIITRYRSTSNLGSDSNKVRIAMNSNSSKPSVLLSNIIRHRIQIHH